jgi:hypothetical protein
MSLGWVSRLYVVYLTALLFFLYIDFSHCIVYSISLDGVWKILRGFNLRMTHLKIGAGLAQAV